jgi:hypothetical protein
MPKHFLLQCHGNYVWLHVLAVGPSVLEGSSFALLVVLLAGR